jgi:hypothetical protein
VSRRRAVVVGAVAAGLAAVGWALWDLQIQGLVAADKAAQIADQIDPPGERPAIDLADPADPTDPSDGWSTDFLAYDALVAAHADEYQALYRPGSWKAWGVLEIPVWEGLDDPIFGTKILNRMPIAEGSAGAGSRDPVLDQAFASHYTKTQGPGEVGNFALAGHRRSRGNSFLLVPELKAGDVILITTPLARLRYQVSDDTSHHYTEPSDTSPLAPSPGDWGVSPPPADEVVDGSNRVLTLQTCTNRNGGPWNNTLRWFTHATLTGWMPR